MKLSYQTCEQLFTRARIQLLASICSVLILFVNASADAAQKQSVTLGWDPVGGVSGYKLYQGGASRVYTNSVNLGNVTQGTVSSLIGGSTYYFAVTAYDSSGVESVYSSEISYTVPASRPHYPRTFAADAGVITSPFISLNGIVSQNLLTSLLGGGEAVYDFTIDIPGNYVISATLQAPSDGENSVYVNVDAEPIDPLMIWDVPVTSGFAPQLVTWRGNGGTTSPQYSPKMFKLSAGDHQLYVRGREPNTQLQSFSINPAGALLLATALPNRMMSLSGVGQPGHQYEIQASTNLKSWTVLGNVTADSTGTIGYTDSIASLFSSRWYRLRDTTP